jgi:hypothetical protein
MGVMIRRLSTMAVVALMAALVVLPVAHAQENAQVRVVHAVPDGPAVDVFVDGDQVLENVSFFTASDYLSVPAGEHLVQVTAAGAAPSSAVISETLTLAAGQSYTVMAAGMPDSIAATVLEDERAVPTAGDTKIRFIHAVPDAPAVDIRQVGDEIPLIANLAFREASDYLPLLPGSYDLNVVATGQTETLFDFDENLIADEPIYDIFLVGDLGAIRAEVANVTVSAASQPAQATTPTAATTAAPATTPTAATTAAPATTPTAATTAAPATTPTAATTAAPATTPTAAATAAPATTPQPPSGLPVTAGRATNLLGLILVAALLIGSGALLWQWGRRS